MSTALFCISLMVGICAGGFLFAGALSFFDTEHPLCGLGWIHLFIDILASLGLCTMLFVIVENWKQKPESRRLLYTGASCLAAALLVGFISFRIS